MPPPPKTPRGSPALPGPPEPGRPTNVIGLISDLTMNPKQAGTFLMLLGGVVLIVSAGVVICLAVARSANGIAWLSPRLWLPVAGSTGFLVTLITVCVKKFVKRGKSAGADADNLGEP